MIKHIIFDLGQVLVNVAFVEFAYRFAQMFEIDPKVLLQAEDSGPHAQFMIGEISGEQFHQQLCRAFKKDVSLVDFKQLWFSMLDGEKEDTVKIARQLKQKGHSLAILSNIDAWHYSFCQEKYPVMKLFDRKFLSFELRLKKPDARIFQLVSQKLGASPEQCLLIDDKKENIESANQVGFQTILFTGASELEKKLKELGLL